MNKTKPAFSRMNSVLVVFMLVFFGTTCSSGDAPKHAIPMPGGNAEKATLPWTKHQPKAAPRAETRPEHSNPWLRPHRYDSSPEHTFAMVLREVGDREGWSMVGEKLDDEAQKYEVRVEIDTILPQWDDVRIKVMPYRDGYSEVRMISRTIERRWDLGANRRRVISMMSALDNTLAPVPSEVVDVKWPEPRPRKEAFTIGVAGPQPLFP